MNHEVKASKILARARLLTGDSGELFSDEEYIDALNRILMEVAAETDHANRISDIHIREGVYEYSFPDDYLRLKRIRFGNRTLNEVSEEELPHRNESSPAFSRNLGPDRGFRLSRPFLAEDLLNNDDRYSNESSPNFWGQ